MIAIINTKKKKKGKTVYNVQINNDLICRFEHDPLDGLGMCLLEASKAVERKRWKESKLLEELCQKKL